MTSKMPKHVFQAIFGLLMVLFTVTACNSKKDEKTETTGPDTTIVKPLPPDTAAATDTMKMDTAGVKPVQTPD